MATAARDSGSESELPLGGGGRGWLGGGRKPLVLGIVALLLFVALGAYALREGAVTVESAPPGAEVWIDGKMAGTTPLTLTTRFGSRSGEFEVRLSGFQSQAHPFTVEPGQDASVSATLLAAKGSVSVTSAPAGARVFLDGTEVGVAPRQIGDVSPGPHTVRVVLAGHHEVTRSVEVVAGESASLTISLAAVAVSAGGFEITSEPSGASVLVDGTERGVTPLRLDGLASGEYIVQVKQAGYEEWLTTIKVEAGSLSKVQANLEKSIQPVATFDRPIAVMIDNHPYARPQSGLSAADVVYEALAEGGVTRFMGIFASRNADVVGPVRSARHYFVNWANEYQAMYTHCGGYPEAYAAIQSTGIANFDDLVGSPGFWRSDARDAPHNLYADTNALRKGAVARNYNLEKGSYGGLLFEEEPAEAAGSQASRLTIYYPHGYEVNWVYSPENHDYARFHSGTPLRDAANGEQLRGSSVAVLYMENWFIGRDDQQDFAQVGSGKALFFLDGKMTEGTWSRESLDTPTLMWDEDGERVALNKGGTTWIQVVPIDGEVAYE